MERQKRTDTLVSLALGPNPLGRFSNEVVFGMQACLTRSLLISDF